MDLEILQCLQELNLLYNLKIRLTWWNIKGIAHLINLKSLTHLDIYLHLNISGVKGLPELSIIGELNQLTHLRISTGYIIQIMLLGLEITKQIICLKFFRTRSLSHICRLL